MAATIHNLTDRMPTKATNPREPRELDLATAWALYDEVEAVLDELPRFLLLRLMTRIRLHLHHQQGGKA